MKPRSVRFWLPPLAVALGTAVFVVGFVYDLNYAGLPHQPDSPIELQQNWEHARAVADRIYLLSAALVALGLGWTVLRLSSRVVSSMRRRTLDQHSAPHEINQPERN